MVETGRPRIVVFDFDGTLIDSNAPKREAFFELFPDRYEHRVVVEEVLCECGEESRYVILTKIVERLEGVSEELRGARVEQLAERYNELVLEGAAACREMPGASDVLGQLSGRYSLYVSSGTPLDPLKTLIKKRGWMQHFKNVFGYPATKVDTLKHIFDREACEPGKTLVVGDGDSDKTAASTTGCRFFAAGHDQALIRLAELLS